MPRNMARRYRSSSEIILEIGDGDLRAKKLSRYENGEVVAKSLGVVSAEGLLDQRFPKL